MNEVFSTRDFLLIDNSSIVFFAIVEKGIFVFRHGRDVPLLLHTGAPSVSLDRFVWTENVTRLMPLHGG